MPSDILILPGGEIVADEEFIDDELDFLGIQIDVPAPPALEFEIAVGLGIDLGIDVVLLGPQRVGRDSGSRNSAPARRRRTCRHRGRWSAR